MKDNTRIALNTIVIYTRLVLVSVITFLSVRYLLNALGETDFGLYNLIGGVVTLFAFLSISMSQSTQRFISMSLGKNDEEELNTRFMASLLLHLAVGCGVAVIIQLGGHILIQYFLHIPLSSINDAYYILTTVTIGTFFTIIRVPYDAVMLAHENITFVSILQTGYAILRLVCIIILFYISNRLHIYAIGMMIISIIYFFAAATYCLNRYEETHWNKTNQCNLKAEIKGMASFTGIYIIGAIATTFRDQGIPLILNVFMGVIINAATAIATQINGIITQFSSTIGSAIRPQLVKNAGAENFSRVSILSYASCKYPALCVVMFSAPLITAMSYIQELWLKIVPEYAVIFSQFILISVFISQLTLGLSGGIDAHGNIKKLYVSTAIIKLFTLPIAWISLKLGGHPYIAYLWIIISEGLSAYIRLSEATKINVVSYKIFFNEIFAPITSVYIINIIFNYLVWSYIVHSFISLLLLVLFSIIIFFLLTYFICLNQVEINSVKSLLSRIQHKL